MLDNLAAHAFRARVVSDLLAGLADPRHFAVAVDWVRLLTISIPPLLPFFSGLRPLRKGTSRRSHLRAVLSRSLLALSQIGLTITGLAYQAWLMADAIVRTLVRMFVTRKNLLEWVTAAQAKHAVDLEIPGIFQTNDRRSIAGPGCAWQLIVFGAPHAAARGAAVYCFCGSPRRSLRSDQPAAALTDIEPLSSRKRKLAPDCPAHVALF